ncbi:beta-N-acetylhexosaminidase [Compostibacter hankyongensis]|uniref:beta-N-acetylhexosaminidase n=1 Tax=Compostibacter hankyongensis TaxID=1007089 RepID=A0ABP8FLQ3_9BACT
MNKIILLAALFAGLFFSPVQAQQKAADAVHLIPEPVSLHTGTGHFRLSGQTAIVVPAGDAEAQKLGKMLGTMLGTPTGYSFPVVSTHSGNQPAIVLALNRSPQSELGEAGYTLRVTPGGVTITANRHKGLFYGMQTLLQLLPPEIESHEKTAGITWDIPAVDILDYPRFGWRGLMLDVSRHFFSKEFVEAYIDQMVKYKYNVFHWHLTDDNGWRVEIKSLPQLTQHGAWRVPRTGRWGTFEKPQPGEKASYGGYYTQDDIREVIKYAQDRFVTIVPEVDIPAHSLSLISTFPNLSCTQLQYPVNPGSPFYKKEDNVLCIGNDSTYLILDKIFTELAQLFPGEYIHVGGDEAYKGFWEKCPKCQALMQHEHLKNVDELQSYFIKKMEKMLLAKGKRLIGWDEILQGGLAPEATVMSWRGMEGGIQAAKMNHHVVMSPNSFTYIDLYQGDPLVEPATYSMLRLSTCYAFEPVPEGVDPKYILGGQANLWAESIANERHAEYMTWPRALAVAEAVWSPAKKKNWDGFVQRMESQFPRFDAAGVKYARSAYDPIISGVKDSGGKLQVKLATEIDGLDIYYTFDGTEPDNHYPEYKGQPLDIPEGASEIRVITYRDGKPIGRQINCPLSEVEKRIKK